MIRWNGTWYFWHQYSDKWQGQEFSYPIISTSICNLLSWPCNARINHLEQKKKRTHISCVLHAWFCLRVESMLLHHVLHECSCLFYHVWNDKYCASHRKYVHSKDQKNIVYYILWVKKHEKHVSEDHDFHPTLTQISLKHGTNQCQSRFMHTRRQNIYVGLYICYILFNCTCEAHLSTLKTQD